MSLREHVSLREHACVSSRGAQSTELVWILDFKQILLLLFIIISDIESTGEENNYINLLCPIFFLIFNIFLNIPREKIIHINNCIIILEISVWYKF